MEIITKILNREDGFDEFDNHFLYVARAGGVLAANRFEEAAVDLLEYAGVPPVAVVAKISLPTHADNLREYIENLVGKKGIAIILLKNLAIYRAQHEQTLEQVAHSHLPTKFGLFEIHILKSKFTNDECIVLTSGQISSKKGLLVRIHSECFTGDALGSLRCDCGDQLHQSLQMLSSAPVGLLIYLKQEGRGIGLMNKIRAYRLQDDGYDTIAANLQLGFKADLREYGLAYQALHFFGIESIKLITNNPDKIQQLAEFGIEITQRIPLEIPAQQFSKEYLKTKKYKLGHLLEHV